MDALANPVCCACHSANLIMRNSFVVQHEHGMQPPKHMLEKIIYLSSAKK
jgi:hypothetical protein